MSFSKRRRVSEKVSLILGNVASTKAELEAVRNPIPQDPVQWAERIRILKGARFSFQDREYLLPLYRDNSHRVIIVKSRQMEMTEWIVNWLLHKLTTYPFTTAIYTAPRMDQVSRFSHDRFRKALLDSPELRDFISKAREAELGETAIGRIPFSNGSICYLISAWGDFGALRNIPADFAAIDEMQDVQQEAIPVIEETMSHSRFGTMIMVGTASDEGGEFSRVWQQSDMKEWDPESGAWIPQRPQNRFYSGYHIDQRMAPWIKSLPPEHPNSIEAKRIRYRSERRFLNEVLGLFYRGLAKPLLSEDLLACRDFQFALMDHLDPPYVSYAGIDWGGGQHAFTVIWIMARDDKDRWRLIYVRKFDERDPMKQVQIIGNLIPLFNIKQAVADIGYGAVQVSELQKRFASRVIGCQYIRRPELPLERKTVDESGKRVAQMLVNADRSFWIETAIELIKHKDSTGAVNPLLVLPWKEPLDVEWIIEQFTCIEMEEQETVSGKKYHHYTHPEGEPDDALHGFIYALIADAYGRMAPPLVVQDLFS
jgi:hypothetical protein